MKVIFLDIDGVMNGFETWPETAGRRWIDPKCVKRLNKITDKTGAVIVVTSTWRTVKNCNVVRLLKDAGVKGQVIDAVPNLPNENRGGEILRWIQTQAHAEVESFVILDDDEDMDYLTSKLVRTSWSYGLQDEQIAPAVKLLS